jgi:uncharacterized membrane protein
LTVIASEAKQTMNETTYIIIFRLLHIICGVFWAGSVFYVVLFVFPAIKNSELEGTKFIQQLAKTGYPIAAAITGIVTIVSGLFLIWKFSNGFERIWFTAASSKVLCLGMIASIIAFVIGFTFNRPAAARINRIDKAIAQGNRPSEEQLQQVTKLKKRIFVATTFVAVLLVITVITMAIFRYVS